MKHLQIIFLAFSLLNAGYNVQDRVQLLQERELNTVLCLNSRPTIKRDTVVVHVELIDTNTIPDSLQLTINE